MGSSLGTDGELNYAGYLFKLIQDMKKYVETAAQKIHPEIKARLNEFQVIVYSPFLKTGKLPFETEAYFKKIKVPIRYIQNTKELEEILI